MSVSLVLRKLTSALDGAAVPYMLTGSFASLYYGLPRSTQDIDLVVSPNSASLQSLITSLPGNEFYADLDAAIEALRRESMFNVIDLATGWKIDLIVRKTRDFSQEEFGRRRLVDFEGVSLWVASAEDIVISKLEWSKLSESRRQIEDVSSILKMQWPLLDQSYLEKWIRALDLKEEWNSAQQAANI